MNILGLSYGFHDSAAALLVDGEIVAAIQEERLSRVKHDAAFPERSVAACLQLGGIQTNDLDAVVLHENKLLKVDRLARSALKDPSRGIPFLAKAFREWVRADKFFPERVVAERLGVPVGKVSCVEHHQGHAASAFYCSPFEHATVLTIDGIGEDETSTVSLRSSGKLRKIGSVRFPHSVGLFYSAMTSYLGFEINEGEYKVMGMAAYGKPDQWEAFLALFDFRGRFGFKLKQDLFDFHTASEVFFTEELERWLGPRRIMDEPFDPMADSEVGERSRRFANVAASVQLATEHAIVQLVQRAVEVTGEKNVCIAGGVGLNSLANARARRELGVNLFVQPAAGDSGCALGAAFLGLANRRETVPPRRVFSPFLGIGYGKVDVEEALQRFGVSDAKHFDTVEERIEAVADRLAQGRIVGWFHGRDEWGPRALGGRSILADPSRQEVMDTVNLKVKFRERFRPFAPSVLAEFASEFFDCPDDLSESSPEAYMLAVQNAYPKARDIAPAIVHLDGTARVQAVFASTNPVYHRLLSVFYEKTGCPILLNSSFNLRGQPMVSSPVDAIETFYYSGIDVLSLESALLEKP